MSKFRDDEFDIDGENTSYFSDEIDLDDGEDDLDEEDILANFDSLDDDDDLDDYGSLDDDDDLDDYGSLDEEDIDDYGSLHEEDIDDYGNWNYDDLDDDYIEHGSEIEEEQNYSDYGDDDDWISHENRRKSGKIAGKKSGSSKKSKSADSLSEKDMEHEDSRSIRKHESMKRRRKRRKRQRQMVLAAIFLLVCLIFIGILKIAGVIGVKTEATLKADKVKVLQNSQDTVNLTATLTTDDAKKAKKVWLDKTKKYSVADFMNELKKGEHYEISTDAKNDTEGKYTIKLKLNSDIQKKLQKEWKHKIRLTVENGTYYVQNAIGTWDGNKFKKYDGSYVASDFVVSKGKTYYFDANGNKVTGKQTINNATYFFSKNGVMQTGWKKTDKATYYLGDNGAAVTGWQTIGKAEYYFDENGVMATGELKVGLVTCKFSKNGKLKSRGDVTIDSSKPMVALTFDDGPGERTGELLEQLEKYNAHATFFMQGKNISGKEDFVKKMKEIGCELGNHSYDHPQLTKLSSDKISNQIGSTNELIKNAAGSSATVMRPPYGAINDTVRASVGLPMILWSIDTLDWKTRNAQSSIDTVMNNVQDGDIILMHDIHTESVDAALVLIPQLEKAGYQLVTVSEMAKAKGIALKNGEKYVDFWAKDVEKYKNNGLALSDTSNSTTTDAKSDSTASKDSSKKDDSSSSKNSSSKKDTSSSSSKDSNSKKDTSNSSSKDSSSKKSN